MNPVYSHPDYSCKDACMAWQDGTWHLFFSAFDQERSQVATVKSRDLRTFTDMQILFDGTEQDLIGMCSPDLARGPDGWVMIFNSWGQKKGSPNALHYSLSTDLHAWTPARRLAPNLAREDRVIDGALAWVEDHWMMACKWWQQLRFAHAPTLEGPWQWVQEASARMMSRETGEDNGYSHENFQILNLDGNWKLLSTDYLPKKLHHHPWLYELEGDSSDPASWMTWKNGRQLQIEPEDWNRPDPDNAAALWDHRETDGGFYLIYGGKNEERIDEFRGTAAATENPWPRGWNKLGLSRSNDLIHWENDIP